MATRSIALLLAACVAVGPVDAARRRGSDSAAVFTAKYGDAELLVTGTSRVTGVAGAVTRATAVYPAAASGAITASAGQLLQISFAVTDSTTGDALVAHQTFVRFTPARGAPSYFVASAEEASPATYKLSLDVSDRAALAGIADGGLFDVDVLVGDATLANPVVWRVATGVTLQTPSAPAKPAPVLYSTPLLHESDTATSPLKTITHVFRAPETRPPAVVSLAAAGVVVGALAVWVLSALGMAGTTWCLPPVTSLLDAAVFHAGFGAILLLFVAFWFDMFGLNMFHAVGYATVLALPTTFFGRRLLVALQARDVAAEAKATKSD